MTALRIFGLLVAVCMIGAGAVFTAQGLGYLEGSSMTGSATWAVLGPVCAGLGVSLVIVILQRRE